MGIAGELVRSVFSKSQFTKNRDSNVKSNAVDKRRWISVRSYLCGDEFKPALEEEESVTVKSSEATVTKPLEDDKPERGNIQSQELKKESLEEDEVEGCDPKSKEQQEAAVVAIQSAFRSFMVRRQLKAAKSMILTEELLRGKESPSRVSMATSVEVQTGNSAGVVSIQEESTYTHKTMQQKHKSQMFKPKEDWDDSTVDSTVSKMRVQNRMEAMTRRERALAYAFSQQLRICSKRKQTITEGAETNMGWSWLERWMATRLPEGSSVQGQLTTHLGTLTDTTRPIIRKKFLDLSFEEKESCGSNEVPVQIDRSEMPAQVGKDRFKPIENRPTAKKPVSRRQTVPTNHCPKDLTKANKRDSSKEAEKDKKQKGKQVESIKKENSFKYLSSELSVDDQAAEKSDPLI